MVSSQMNDLKESGGVQRENGIKEKRMYQGK
jgi:hypothetical protein